MPLGDEAWTAVFRHEDTELGPPADAGEVERFERENGRSLPPLHREFLLRANGGAVGYVRLFGVGWSDGLDLGKMLAEMRPFIQGADARNVLPFASTWGGSYYCYDLDRPNAEGDYAVLLWNHDYSEESADRQRLWSAFSTGFREFLARVTEP